jgi:hypothetical protein
MCYLSERGRSAKALVCVSGGKPTKDNTTLPVSLCVTPPGVEVTEKIVADCHTTGFHEQESISRVSDQVEALAAHIGIELPPNYMGQLLEPDAAQGPGF